MQFYNFSLIAAALWGWPWWDKAHFVILFISVPQWHQKLFLQPGFWGEFWEKLSLLSLSFKAAAYKNLHGKISLHVETENVHTAKEGFP